MLVQPPRCCNHRGTRRQNAQCRETGLGRRKPARKTSLRVGGRKRSADEPCAVALRAGRFYDARPRVDNQPREGRNASLGRKGESAARSESRRRLDSTNDSPHASNARARSPARTYRRRVRAASPVEPGSDPVKGGESAASQPGHEAFEGERSAPGPLEQSSVMSSVVRAQPERDAQGGPLEPQPVGPPQREQRPAQVVHGPAQPTWRGGDPRRLRRRLTSSCVAAVSDNPNARRGVSRERVARAAQDVSAREGEDWPCPLGEERYDERRGEQERRDGGIMSPHWVQHAAQSWRPAPLWRSELMKGGASTSRGAARVAVSVRGDG